MKNSNLKGNFLLKEYLQYYLIMYKFLAGNYCVGVTPDPISNSEVKPFSANGTLS